MQLHEFELRYLTYTGLQEILGLDRSQADIIQATHKTNDGALTKSIQETSVEELHELTEATYTPHKKELLKKYASTNYKDTPVSDYIERLEYEFKVIHEMGYNTYFLVVADYIIWSKDNNIVVGPGRGSCAGSLLSYCMQITDIDPIEYDLIFERFLNPGRISMPDIDTDFEDTQRDRVIEYIRDKYGEDKVAHIGTYMTMAAKAAFKDVARVYGINFEQSNKLSALITEKTIAKSIEANKDLQQAIDNDQRIENVVRIASNLEGTIRQTGVHACGMIIAPEATTNYTAIQHPPQSGRKHSRDESRIVSQYDGRTVETVGLLKMDLLGLRNLSIIKNTIKIITAKSKKENTELPSIFQEFNETTLFHPPLDDLSTYQKIFHTGNTSGIFQFESDGMKGRLKKLKPTHFDDLIAMVSLYRPGPMEYIPRYIDRKYEIEKVSYMEQELWRLIASKHSEEMADTEKEKLVTDLTPFMQVTYGIPVYQEQLMRIVQAMAGFSMAEADKLRKGVGKKIREVIEKIKVEFITKAATHRDYTPETAQRIYEKMIEPAADYSFNKSHAACYAYISYQTAWLKAHYPLAFHAALLRSVEEDTDKLAKFIDEIKLQGHQIKLPDVNASFEHVAAVEDYIILGFSSIKGIGSDMAQAIEEERGAHGTFKDLGDFLKRTSDYINKKSLEALIKSGALDKFYNRSTLRANISRMIDWLKSSEQHAASGGGLFAVADVDGADLQLEEQAPLPLLEKLEREYSIFKSLISGHPLDGMYDALRGKYTFISMMKDVEGFGDYTVLGMIKSISRGMRGGYFVMVEDISGEMEFFLNEKLDLQVFDIINITGYKGRRFPSTNAIYVFDYDALVDKLKASGQYNPENTVAKVRAERFADTTPTDSSSLAKDKKETSSKDISPSTTAGKTNTTPDTPSSPPEAIESSSHSFPAPDNMLLLAQLPALIKQYPGDITVTIGNTSAQVNQTGVEKIAHLLQG